MSSDQPSPNSRHFRKAAVRMDPQQATRQGAAARIAFAAFGDRDRALAYLNDHHAELNGRPIDLAIASDDGLLNVQSHLAGLERATAVPNAQAISHPPFSPTD